MRFGTSGPSDGDIPLVAYQLADHLDAALAAAEDLAEAGRAWVPASARESVELAAEMAAERQVIERVRTFEAMLIGRVLKARKRAQVLANEAGDFAGMTRLFVGGTAPLVDAVEELGDSTRTDFETGECRVAYLRQRGVIAADAADLPDERHIELGGDTFLIAGRIALAPMVEMIVAFLDALEAHYDLWPDDDDGDRAVPLSWADVVKTAQDAHHDARGEPQPVPTSEDVAALCGTTAEPPILARLQESAAAEEAASDNAGCDNNADLVCADAEGQTSDAAAATSVKPSASSANAAGSGPAHGRSLMERLNSIAPPAE